MPAPTQAPEIDAATLNMLPDESREALLQRLLEKKLRCFATQVRLLDMHMAVTSRLPSVAQAFDSGSSGSECVNVTLQLQNLAAAGIGRA